MKISKHRSTPDSQDNPRHPVKSSQRLDDAVVRLVQLFVLIVTIVFWFVVGFIFWIPLLTRTIAIYCAAMMAAAIGNGEIGHLKELLDRAVEFYPKGFTTILEYHRGERTSSSPSQSVKTETTENAPERIHGINWKKVREEMIWTAVFWISITSLVYGVVTLLL